MNRNIVRELKDLLIEELGINLKPEEIKPTDSLFETGLNIDSVLIIEFIGLLEDRFSIELDENDLTPENFSDLKSISMLIEEKLKVNN